MNEDVSSQSRSHEEAYATSRIDRDRTLVAAQRLETSLGRAAGGAKWLASVSLDLEAFESAMRDEQAELHRPDALLSLIESEHPRRFGPRIRGIQEQYDDLIRQVVSLRRQLGDPAEAKSEVADVRQRIGWVIRALHHCRARQTDLVYEALGLDLGQQ